jgi:flagellar hook-length control protein FliK
LLDIRSQGPPSTLPPATNKDDTTGTALPTGGNFLPLLFMSAWPAPSEPTVLPPGAGTGTPPGAGTKSDPIELVQTAVSDAQVARRGAAFDPILRTAQRVIELLRPTETHATDPACPAPVTPSAASASRAASDIAAALAPAVNVTAAIAQAAPEMLAALLKRAAPDPGAGAATQAPQDPASYLPLVDRTDKGSAAAAPPSQEVRQFIDALPRHVAADQLAAPAADGASIRVTADAPSAPLFIDGHGLRSHAAAPAGDASAPNLRLEVPLRSPEWAQALGERITWLVDQKFSSAEIKLNPPQLGPIEVRIALAGDSTQVTVSAHSPITRDALEAAAPRLREALTSHGLGNVSVDISQQSFADRTMTQSHSNARSEAWEPWQALTPQTPTAGGPRTYRFQQAGRLDAYA